MTRPGLSVFVLSVGAVLVACTGAAPEAAPAAALAAAAPREARQPVRSPGKPRAPVTLSAVATPAGAGRWDVTVSAQPTRDLGALELDWVGRARRDRLGAVAAGATRETTARLIAGRPGEELFVAAIVTADGVTMREVVSVRLGEAPAPAAEPRRRSLTLPSGVGVDEVQP